LWLDAERFLQFSSGQSLQAKSLSRSFEQRLGLSPQGLALFQVAPFLGRQRDPALDFLPTRVRPAAQNDAD
jgi:hypothetical protein